MTVTDAEREYYEGVLADTTGKSLSDLRYAYYLQALDTGGYITRDYGDATLNFLETGQETIPRPSVVSAVTTGSGSLRLAYLTARKSETVTAIRVLCVAAAGATPTLVRLGLYSVADNGGLSLLAATPNDTTLLAAPSTSYQKTLSSPVAVVKGTRYAVGVLVVTGAAIPTVLGNGSGIPSEHTAAPRLCAVIGSQTDLPSSVAAGDLLATTQTPYVVLVP